MLPDFLQATLAALPPDAHAEPGRSLRATLLPAQRTASGSFVHRPPTLESLPGIRVDDVTAGGFGLAEAAAPSPSADLSVVGELGEGGMGRVTLVAQRSLRRQLALKTAHKAPSATVALIHEGVITGMLEHPNIPPIHALVRDADGHAALVMKHIAGVTLAEVLASPTHPFRGESPLFSGRDGLTACLEILVQISNALELAHASGVIHRDIKPSNVMLGKYGEVYLIDWGVAYHAAWHEKGSIALVGTASYLAPEMALCEEPDPRTDVYLLGATLFEILTGKAPHDSPNLRGALLHAIASAPPELGADLPHELADLCRRSLACDRGQRPASVGEFRDAIRSHFSHGSSIALTNEAESRLLELERVLRDERAELASIARLQDECRFAFAQALREWPGNERARTGLSNLSHRLAEHEIAQDNPRGAKALLADVRDARPSLLASIAELEARHDVRDEEARELDLRAARAERIATVASTVVLCLLVLAWRILDPPHEDPHSRHVRMVAVWLVMTVVVGVVTSVVGWHQKRRSSRSWRGLMVSLVFGVLLNRLGGLILLPGVAPTLASDLSVILAVVLLAGFSLARNLLWLIVPVLVGFALIAAAPRLAAGTFIATGMVLMLGVFVLLRQGERTGTVSPRASRKP